MTDSSSNDNKEPEYATLVLKLINGDEIIGEVLLHEAEDESLDVIGIINPFRVIQKIETSTRSMFIDLVRWIGYSFDEVTLLRKSHILCFNTPTNQVLDLYDALVQELEEERKFAAEDEQIRSAENGEKEFSTIEEFENYLFLLKSKPSNTSH